MKKATCGPCKGTGEGVPGTEMSCAIPCKLCKGKGSIAELEEDDFVYVPLDQIDKPRNGWHMDVIVNSWWCVHPEKGLAFYNPKYRNGKRRRGHGNPYGSPQCNPSKEISERLNHEWTEVKFVEAVFLPLIISDYVR